MSALTDQNSIVLKTFTAAAIKKASETPHEALFTPGTGKRFVLRGFVIVSAVATTLTLEDGAVAFAVFPLEAKVPLVFMLPGQGYISTALNNKLQAKIGEVEATGITGTFFGNEVYN